jgi:predicted component of type VI protein secretion system
MKVSLVVASGVHQGKVIPIVGPQFLVGRDPQCQLRPASQAISKQHCAILVRDGKVYVKDFGSTNGTLVNDGLVKGEERPLTNNDNLKIGPLDFTVRIELSPARADATPLPEANAEAAAALAAVKAAAAAAPKAPARDATPAPGKPAAKQSDSKNMTAPKPAEPKPAARSSSGEPDQDEIAAMLLGMTDDGNEPVPGGSTVMDMPAELQKQAEAAAKPEEKKDDKKAPSREDTSSAARDLLSKYMRRPK